MFIIRLTNIDELVMANTAFSALLDSLKLSKMGIEGILSDETGEIDEDTRRLMTREYENVNKSIVIQDNLLQMTLVLLEDYSKKFNDGE